MTYGEKGFFYVKGTIGIEKNEGRMVVKDRLAEQEPTAYAAVEEAMA